MVADHQGGQYHGGLSEMLGISSSWSASCRRASSGARSWSSAARFFSFASGTGGWLPPGSCAGDSDIGIGPAAILDTLLLVADRGVDRGEAVARAQDVTELVSHVRDPRVVAKMLTKYSLALMQNVDEKTSQDLGDAVGKIMADPDVPDTIKMDIVALRLGIVVGPDVLEAAVAALGDRLNSTSIQPAPPPVQPQSTVPASPTPAAPPPTAADLKAEIDKSPP
jgi:hypothetical protein